MQHLQPNTTLQGGKYRIERVLGQGGFGNTYVGYNTEFEETVAIKEFFMKGVTERDGTTSEVSVSNADNVEQFEEQREKFKKEARRLRRLKNEHIVKVHDLFEENGTAYYEMDYIDGESLAERMKRTGSVLDEIEVKSILLQVLDALKEVHQNEIWHLDLKPGNIMMDKNGKAYLIDFGASKQIRADGSMTTSTALCYTPGYAPSEQIGQMYDLFGPWTDIYALGATIYNLLTNKKPPRVIDIEEDEINAFSFPATVSEEMKALIYWMMQPKRKARPQNVDEILSKLKIAELGNNNQLHPLPDGEETIIASEHNDFEETIIEPHCSNESNPEYVDLGVSVKWASENLIVDNYISNFKGVEIQNLNEWDDIPSDFGGTPYDPASVASNNKYRLPTRVEWEELINKCKWEWKELGNKSGYTITGKNGNQIFLPSAGGYWSCTISPSDVMMNTYYLRINPDKIELAVSAYTILRSIRPILQK